MKSLFLEERGVPSPAVQIALINRIANFINELNYVS